MRTAGIHHITAIASDPLRNLAFYREVLGLRLVKRTVNFDDPGSYHFYFGDEAGSPGSILTFFSWPGAGRGSPGSSQVMGVSFAISVDSTGFWKERLSRQQIEEMPPRFGERVLRFFDPDGLTIEFIAAADPMRAERWRESPIPAEHQIRGFAAPAFHVTRTDLTEEVLTKLLGFGFAGEDGKYRRFEAGENCAASRLDILFSDAAPGRIAAGNVHHIAFRAADEAEQRWREELVKAGFAVSPVMDRRYFRSIYFREPNGILFEIATDGPGFTIDEPADALGQSLKLPPMFESMRAQIERVLPALERAA